jgi:hypothetical protein
MNTEEISFLYESNKIEREYDADSLVQACYAWEYMSSLNKITVGDILRVHKILMLHYQESLCFRSHAPNF